MKTKCPVCKVERPLDIAAMIGVRFQPETGKVSPYFLGILHLMCSVCSEIIVVEDQNEIVRANTLLNDLIVGWRRA